MEWGGCWGACLAPVVIYFHPSWQTPNRATLKKIRTDPLLLWDQTPTASTRPPLHLPKSLLIISECLQVWHTHTQKHKSEQVTTVPESLKVFKSEQLSKSIIKIQVNLLSGVNRITLVLFFMPSVCLNPPLRKIEQMNQYSPQYLRSALTGEQSRIQKYHRQDSREDTPTKCQRQWEILRFKTESKAGWWGTGEIHQGNNGSRRGRETAERKDTFHISISNVFWFVETFRLMPDIMPDEAARKHLKVFRTCGCISTWKTSASDSGEQRVSAEAEWKKHKWGTRCGIKWWEAPCRCGPSCLDTQHHSRGKCAT